MIFKCKICGGELNVQKGQSIVECEYCGVKQTLPRFLDENVKLMYDRANSYLLHNEFDKAENIYNQILLADKEDAEAYWNLVLCKYGVTYVKDPASGKYIPTCNRTHYASVFNDENYQNAIKYANAEKVELYKQDATTIDDIQRGILSISKHEKPFDIFISYKETGENGARTKDSIKAQELYDKLTAEGYKVFFSRITLEDKIGTEYEPYIYAALASSKIMLVIGSSKDNLEAVWVKNEWSRYLSFVQRDSEKTLIPLYFDMGKADLPEEFAHLTAYDMTVDGFEQELIRGIKKLIPLPVMLAERRKKFRRKLKIAGVAILGLAIIGGIASVPWFMKLPDYNAAMQLYYDKNYPEATWAFADLGSYRDSEEMKDKCERSWRNSQANITANTLGNGLTAYYITANGTVDTFDYAPGTLNQGLDINEHGKICSIVDMAGALSALYEDGYVKVYTDYLRENEPIELSNIIKISPHFDVGFVALKNDGKVYVHSEDNAVENWLQQVGSWEDIISIDFHRSSSGAGGLVHEAIIVGITKDKTLKIALYNFMNFHNENFYDENVHSKFRNIEKVDANLSDKFLNIAALTSDGKLLTEIEGVFNSYDIKDAVDVELVESYDADTSSTYYEIYILSSNGNVYKYGNNNYLITDVIYIDNGVLVTQSGNIYRITENGLEQTEGKTRILNEWLERLD